MDKKFISIDQKDSAFHFALSTVQTEFLERLSETKTQLITSLSKKDTSISHIEERLSSIEKNSVPNVETRIGELEKGSHAIESLSRSVHDLKDRVDAEQPLTLSQLREKHPSPSEKQDLEKGSLSLNERIAKIEKFNVHRKYQKTAPSEYLPRETESLVVNSLIGNTENAKYKRLSPYSSSQQNFTASPHREIQGPYPSKELEENLKMRGIYLKKSAPKHPF